MKSDYKKAHEAATNLKAFLQPLEHLINTLGQVVDAEEALQREIKVRKEVCDSTQEILTAAEQKADKMIADAQAQAGRIVDDARQMEEEARQRVIAMKEEEDGLLKTQDSMQGTINEMMVGKEALEEECARLEKSRKEKEKALNSVTKRLNKIKELTTEEA